MVHSVQKFLISIGLFVMCVAVKVEAGTGLIQNGPFWVSDKRFILIESDSGGATSVVLRDEKGMLIKSEGLDFDPTCIEDDGQALLFAPRGAKTSVRLDSVALQNDNLILVDTGHECTGFIPAKRHANSVEYTFDSGSFTILDSEIVVTPQAGAPMRFARPLEERKLDEFSYDIIRAPARTLIYHRTTSASNIDSVLIDGPGLRVFEITDGKSVSMQELLPPAQLREILFRNGGLQVLPVGDVLFAILVSNAGAWVTDGEAFVQVYAGTLKFNRFRSVLQRRGCRFELVPRGGGAVTGQNEIVLIDACKAMSTAD